MNESNFPKLNEHLQEVRPIFDDFCARNKFVYADQKSLGRYPRIRVVRSGPPKIWFDLWMELDKEGKRINEFSPDVPYELGAGSFLDVPDGLKQGMRFHKSVICFSGVPFDHLKSILPGELQRTLKILEKWDSPYLKEHGEKVKLDR